MSVIKFITHLAQIGYEHAHAGQAFSARTGRSAFDASLPEAEDAEASASSGYGHHSGYGPQYVYAEEEKECETGLNPFLLAATAAVAAGGAFLIFNQITTGGKRKRDISLYQEAMEWLNTMTGGMFYGLESFENKIDNIASGVDKDENSWINKLYKQYHGEDKLAGESADDARAASADNSEGLESPVLDTVNENRAFKKRSADSSSAAVGSSSEDHSFEAAVQQLKNEAEQRQQ